MRKRQKPALRYLRVLCATVSMLVVVPCGCSKGDARRDQLVRAIRNNDYTSAAQLLRQSPKLANAEVSTMRAIRTPQSVLIIAVENNHASIAELLIRKGAEVTYRDYRQWTALHYAAERGSSQIMELLLAAGADPDICDNDGLTPMMLAVESGERTAVDLLRNSGAKSGCRLHEAAALGDFDAAIAEVKRAPQAINSRQHYWSPLALAARHGHLEVAAFLVRNGACVDDEAFREAARSGHLSVVKLLRPHILNIDDNGGGSVQYTALQVAAMEGHTAVVTYLLHEGADPEVVTQGFTTIELARNADQNRIADLLVRHMQSKP